MSVYLTLAIALGMIPGCQSAEPNARLTIVTTVGMVTDIVRQVVGDNADVVGLIGEGTDPHTHALTRHDVSQLNSADIVFFVGLKLEGKMDGQLKRLADRGRSVFAVTDGIDHEKLRQDSEHDGHLDPHVWMDVSIWSQCVTFVADTMADQDPDNAIQYAANAKDLQKRLNSLNQYVTDVVASIPQQQRVLVTAHDAFGYFSRAYNIDVRSIQGISTESQAGINDINRLVDFVVQRQIAAIFVESSVPRRHVQAVIDGAKDKGWAVHVGGELYSDAMGPHGNYTGTYIGMIDHNATIIARALGGQAPQSGHLLRLNP
ncbi:MAG: zinc ABC transporter substrate-binding protein [Planctomycetaceae bacterium]